MLCPRCQHENPVGVKFCGECGLRIETRCASCQTLNPPTNKYCHECGELLGGAEPPLQPSALTPKAYTPKYLADKILTTRDVLQGDRKQVTVLFADLKSSMELLADRDPEEAQAILDPVLERMMAAVHQYEGTVNQVMGDGIMALFGAPLAHEDHAVRACYAALAMQDAVKQLAEAVWRATGTRVQIRVGLNSGEVVVRSIGNDLHMDYTAVGRNTHLAARMEQLALPGSTVLTADTLRLVEGYVQVKSLGAVPVKGLDAPVEVYELVGAGSARSRLQAAAARGLTRFVGRDAELELLGQTLEQARAGHGQVVALVGEPGVGKSRLVWELSHSHRTQGWLVLESSSVSYGKATAYLPLIDLLKAYCGIETRDDARKIREKVTGKLFTLDRALEPTLPALLALLDVPVGDPAWQTLDPLQRRQRTLDACKRLLLREAREQPLLLVFEDLHWIDAETQALLDSLVDSVPTARLLLLVSYRPEYAHRWGSKTYYRQLQLDPLARASAEALLRALLGGDTTLAALTRLLVERTEGNPFFLEESVRALVESGALVGERGAYRLDRAVETTQVPATVQAVLAARIDRLAAEDKRLLQSAAVVGKDVPFGLLQAIADEPEDRLRQGLTRLQTAEFLYEASLFPELEYTFKHALTHEVAYGSLLQERRRALHARIVSAVEVQYPERLGEQAELLAHHAFRGEVWDTAVGYLRQAGAKAVEHSAYREAVAYFEQALLAIAHIPDSRAARLQALDIHMALPGALVRLAQHHRSLDYLREAEALAVGLDDRHRLGDIAVILSANYWAIGDHERAIECGERALAIADAFEDDPLRKAASSRLSASYQARGEYRRALDLWGGSAASSDRDLLHHRFGNLGLSSVMSELVVVNCCTELGEFIRGVVPGQEAIRLAEAIDEPWHVAATHWGLGRLYLCQGDLARASALLERSWNVCQAAQMPGFAPNAAAALGYTYALGGRLDEALPLLERGVEPSASAQRLVYLGEGYLLAGRLPEARAAAERALEMARHHQERGNEAWALRLLGEIATQGDPPGVEQAEAPYREALALAEELGMRPLVAHCHSGLSALYGRVGRDEDARGELAAASELYRGMEMPYWLARVESELARGAVGDRR